MVLRTLGELTLSGSSFTRSKPLLLLAYLALEGLKERRHLAELFYPDTADSLNSLSKTLSRLRQAAPGVVKADEARVWTEIETDALLMLSALEHEEVEKGIGLYKGAFLEGLSLPDWGAELEEWVYSTREFLARRVQEAYLQLGEREAGKGNFREAARHAETAFKLPGASGLEPENFERTHLLLVAGNSALASEVRREAQSFGISPRLSGEEARERLRTEMRYFLPGHGTSFVGRVVELKRIAQLFSQEECRLLTLTGSGGSGKTKLALEAAHRLQASSEFRDGVFFVPLESLTSAETVPISIASALGLPLQGTVDPLVQVHNYLRGKHALIVLDNLEHLLDAATLVSELLAACPRVNVLATSRERLNLIEEWVLPVGGLPLPAKNVNDPNEALKSEAVQLFLQRAKQADLNFTLEESLKDVIAICHLVDGSPLGIELSAVWVRMMSCAEIAREIIEHLDFLTTSTRNVPERHKSLRAAFEHSWKLLVSKEQEVLRKLSVFRGGFKREAATVVVGASIAVLAALVDKSLLRVTPSGRYDRHPLLYQYTQEKLAEHPEERAVIEEKHGLYYLRFVRERERDLRAQKRRATLALIEEELPNIRVAWTWAIENERIEEIKTSALAIGAAYAIHTLEVAKLFARAIENLDETNPAHHAALGYALLLQAWGLSGLTRYGEAGECVRRSLELLRPLREVQGIVVGPGMLGTLLWLNGDLVTARSLYEEGLALSRAHPGLLYTGRLYWGAAMIDKEFSPFPQVKQLFQEALVEVERVGDLINLTDLKHEFGVYLVRQGFAEEGAKLVRESLQQARELNIPRLECFILVNLSLATYRLGEYDQAEVLALEALTLADKLSMKDATVMALIKLSRVAMARGNHPEAQQHLKEGLRVAWACEHPFSISEILILLSKLSIAQGKTIEAAERLGLVQQQPGFLNEHKLELERLLEVLREQVSEVELAEALERGKSTKLEEVVQEILIRVSSL